MPHHQVWKQKGEEYRLFGGGGWVWTSGLQCRKRKRPKDEKDTFANKKRRLLDTTNKLVALKERKRNEALKKEADKVAKITAQQATPQTKSLLQEKSAATSQAVAPVTSSTLQGSVQAAPGSTAFMVQSSAQSTAVVSVSSASCSTALKTTSAIVSTTSLFPVHFVPQTLSSTATSLQSSINLVVKPIATANQPVASGVSSVALASLSSQVPSSSTVVTTINQPISSAIPPVKAESSSSQMTSSSTVEQTANQPVSSEVSSGMATSLPSQIASSTTVVPTTDKPVSASSSSRITSSRTLSPMTNQPVSSMIPPVKAESLSSQMPSSSTAVPKTHQPGSSEISLVMATSSSSQISSSVTLVPSTRQPASSPIPPVMAESSSSQVSSPVTVLQPTANQPVLSDVSPTPWPVLSEIPSVMAESHSSQSPNTVSSESPANAVSSSSQITLPTTVVPITNLPILSDVSPAVIMSSSHIPLSNLSQAECSTTSSFSQSVSSSVEATVDKPTVPFVLEADSLPKSSLLPAVTSSSSETPSSAVDSSSGSPSSTSLVAASDSAVKATCDGTSASSSLDSNIVHSVSSCSTVSSLLTPAATKTTSALTLKSVSSTENGSSTDFVSTKPPTVTSFVSAAEVKDSFDLPHSSPTLVPSKSSSETLSTSLDTDVSNDEDINENTGCLPTVDTVTDGDAVDQKQKSQFSTENVSSDSSTTVSSGIGDSTKYTTGIELCKKRSKDQASASTGGSHVTVDNHFSHSEICNSVGSNQSDPSDKSSLSIDTPKGSCPKDETVTLSESAVTQNSSPCNRGADLKGSITEEETLVDGISSNVSQNNAIHVDSSLSSAGFTNITEDFSGHRTLDQESTVVPSNDDTEKESSKHVNEVSSEDRLAGKAQNDKCLSLETRHSEAVEVEKSGELDVSGNVLDSNVTKQDQGNIDHSKENEVHPTETSNDLDAILNCNTEHGHESFNSKKSRDSKDGKIRETEREVKSLQDNKVDDEEDNRSLSDKNFPSDNEALFHSQISNTIHNDSSTTENEPKGGTMLLETEKQEDSDRCKQMSVLGDSPLNEYEKDNNDVGMEDVSAAGNDGTPIKSDGDCIIPKSSPENIRPGNLCNHDEKTDVDDTEMVISTTTSKDEITESSAKALGSPEEETTDLISPPRNNFKDDQSTATVICKDKASERVVEGSMASDNNKTDVNESSVGSKAAESVCVPSESQVCQSEDSSQQVSSSSDCAVVVTTSGLQTPITADTDQGQSQQEEPMDVDVTAVSPMLKSSSDKSPQTSIVSDVDSCSHVSLATECKTTPVTSADEVAVTLEGGSVVSSESLPGSVTSSICSTTVSSAVFTVTSTGISSTTTVSSHSTGKPDLSGTRGAAVPAVLPSQSTSQHPVPLRSGPVQSVGTIVSQSKPTTASTAPTVLTGTVPTTALVGMPPVVSNVPLASSGVVKAGTLSVVAGGSSLLPSAPTPPAKGSVVSAVPAVMSTPVRAISSQKTPIAVRPQGQTTQYVPIGPKPILPSSRPTVQSTSLQGSNVVRANNQPTVLGQSRAVPVNSIAALVASLPASGATIGPSQLIRLVTPDGRSITLQGSQLAAIAQQAGSPLGLAVPKTITVQVSGAAAQSPVTTVQKTVGTVTQGATITVQRTQQQAAQMKPQVVVKPRLVTKPIKEEKFPSLEPLIKDPRGLLNRRLAKWPLRHSVKSIFALQKHDLKRLGRRAGMKEVSGYVYASRAVGVNWPAGIPRPSFKVAWRFRTQSLKTLAGAGLQLRILHSCLKWDEMNVRPPRGNSNTVYTSSGESQWFILFLSFLIRYYNFLLHRRVF